jgi:hypothetical protein
MRIQLTADAAFNIQGAGGILLREASIIGDGPGDYPISQILGFAATAFMRGVDAAGSSAVTAAGGPRYMRITAPSDGGPLPLPAAFGGKSWAAA